MHARWCRAVLLTALVGGCDGDPGDSPPDAGVAVPAPAFEVSPCGSAEAPSGLKVTCGAVRVPERRGDPASPPIILRVAVLHAMTATPVPDPVVFLDGGPGGSGIASAVYYAAWSVGTSLSALLARRDVIGIDLRGTGAAQPALGCPEVGVRALPPGGGDDFDPAAVRDCRRRLQSEGATLAAYDTAAAADDIEAVRQALGLPRWNLVGTGYGARLALEVIRRHPAGIRAVVLDSVTPPSVDALAEQGPNLARALAAVFDGCARLPECDAVFPDLPGALAEVVDRLDATPADVATHGQSVTITGRAFVEAVAAMVRDTDSIGQLPLRLRQARQGDLSYFAAVLGAPRGRASMGVHLTVMCAEAMAATSAQAIEARAATLPAALRGALPSRFYPLACPLWAVPAAPPEVRAPVRSQVPALVLAGEFDPLTAPGWAQIVAATLPRARVMQLPRHGHALTHAPCPAALAAAFLDTPARAPDVAACSLLDPPFALKP